MYKVTWKIRAKYSSDGYFHKTITIKEGSKEFFNKADAEELRYELERAVMLLGLIELSEVTLTGIAPAPAYDPFDYFY